MFISSIFASLQLQLQYAVLPKCLSVFISGFFLFRVLCFTNIPVTWVLHHDSESCFSKRARLIILVYAIFTPIQKFCFLETFMSPRCLSDLLHALCVRVFVCVCEPNSSSLQGPNSLFVFVYRGLWRFASLFLLICIFHEAWWLCHILSPSVFHSVEAEQSSGCLDSDDGSPQKENEFLSGASLQRVVCLLSVGASTSLMTRRPVNRVKYAGVCCEWINYTKAS